MLDNPFKVENRRHHGKSPVVAAAIHSICFPSIPPAAENISHSKHLFDRTWLYKDRLELAESINIPIDKLEDLVKLSNLVRINGVGPVFARILVDAGIDSLGAFMAATPGEIIDRVTEINAGKEYIKVTLNSRDIEFCLETAQDLPDVVE